MLKGTMMTDLDARLRALEWTSITDTLDRQGWVVAPLLTSTECGDVDALWGAEAGLRKRVLRERHGFGEGLYKYWSYPLPPGIARLRHALYAALMPVAET